MQIDIDVLDKIVDRVEVDVIDKIKQVPIQKILQYGKWNVRYTRLTIIMSTSVHTTWYMD